jgi:HAE1 family hydrophobic/amphiphilic exporter-1
LIIGLSEAAQDISYSAMAERQMAVINAVLEDPAVASVGSAIGAGGGTTTINNGRMFIALKPNNERDATADQVVRRLQTRLARIQGITLYMQAAQDITIGGRLSKTQYQYTLADADPGELNRWAALFLDKIKTIPGITDITTDQENAGPLLDITVNREVASSFGILPSTVDNTLDDAFGQRIVIDHVHDEQRVSRGVGSRSQIPVRARGAQQHLYQFVDGTAGGVAYPD